MTGPMFEARLAEVFERYVAPAPVEVDPATVAATAAASGTTSRRVPIRLLLPAAAAIALVALAAVAAGGLVVRQADRPIEVPEPYRLAFVDIGTTVASAGNTVSPIAVTLRDGRVVIAGGGDAMWPSTVPAQVIDPIAGTSVEIGEALNGGGTGVLLDDGRVLFIAHDRNATSSLAYLFDPATTTFTRLPQPGFSNAPPFGVEPSLVRLDGGLVLVTGGKADVYKSDLLATAMLFDPATATFSPTGDLHTARWRHSMTRLADGRVLVAGGERAVTPSGPAGLGYLDDAELYDPSTGTFTTAGRMPGLQGPTLGVALRDGRVVIFARWTQALDYRSLESGSVAYDPEGTSPVVVFDAASGAMAPRSPIDGVPETSTLLRDGRILLTGSYGDMDGWTTWAGIYDPSDGSFQPIDPPPAARLPAVAALPDGRVVLAGGLSADLGYPEPAPEIQVFE